MENITGGVGQLFKNLCHSSGWNYAVLWKLQETTQMLLACEDVYVSAAKSRITLEYAPCTGFHSSDPVITTVGWETNIRTGDIPGFSIEVMISNISRYCYFLGEGTVGITALTEKHKWISLWELKSRLALEYPAELQLQVAAGIKTILLVPVLPLGVVQLGSFYELSEDLKMVAHIKDLFLIYHQCALELQFSFDLEKDNGTALGGTMIRNCSACLVSAVELTDPSNFQPAAMQDWSNLNNDEVIEDEFLPRLTVQPYDPLSQDGLGTNSSEEIILDAMCNELLSEYSMEQVVIDSSSNTVSRMVGDQSILSYHDEEINMIPVISNCLASEDPIMSDNEYTFDLYHVDEACLGFGEEFDVVMDSITDGMLMNYPGEAIQSSSLFELNESAWIAKQSEANELTNSISILEVVEQPAAIMKDNSADYLPDDKDFEASGYQLSCNSLSGKCPNSSITQCKDGDLMGSENTIPGIHRIMPSLISNTDGFTSHIMDSVNIHSNEDQQDREQEVHKSSNKKGKKRGRRGPRPRDRQLIQDRITELRELIPNGSKCSIDELLEKAVTHMMFLESVPAHADKLNKSKRTKVCKDPKCQEKPLPHGSSLVWELATKRNNLPLIIENLEQPDQMLIEIECRDYGLFLDTAQAFKRLKLTILEGILQSRSREQQWAHFIVQVPVGFNRMDILWPLMRLLQFKF